MLFVGYIKRAMCNNQTVPFLTQFVLSCFLIEQIVIRFSMKALDKSDYPYGKYNGFEVT